MRSLSLLLCLLLAASLVCPASANSWGLKGDLLDAVSDVDTWDDYHTLDRQAGDAAVMHSRYQNTLMLWEDGRLRTFPTAVYQPDDHRDDELSLTGSEQDFVLNYGDDEWYSFGNLGSGWYLTGTRTGTGGSVGHTESPSSTVTRGYNASDPTGSAVIPYGIPLREFNIRLFPRTVREVRHLNRMHAALNSGENILGWWADDEDFGRRYSGVGQGTTPVYSAPFGKAAWRAAKGKASVGLSGDLWVLRYVTNADGERYACIRYEVSERTQRIGYIPAEVLGEEPHGEPSEDLIHVPLYASRETYLTDDPLCSQYPQFTVPAGTRFECLGLFNRWYAYVAAEVKNGRFVDGGQIVWGFVPLRDLALDADTHGNILWDVMEALEGSWEFYAGGNQAEDILILHADGTYTGKWLSGEEAYPDTHGSWFVIEYHPFWNLYWNDPPYEITLVDEDGTVNVKGLSINEEGFSLTDWEGGGGYRRMEEAVSSAPDIQILPNSPDAAIPTQKMAAELYPGYTLQTFETFNYDTAASASYSRLDGSILHIRRVSFRNEQKPLIQDCLPVPISPSLCEQLRSFSFSSLICSNGSDSLFRTEESIDRSRIPIQDKIIESDLHTDTLILLTEDPLKQRRVRIVTMDEQGQYHVTSSSILPEQTSLDIFHAREDLIYTQWDGQYRIAAFCRTEDGEWLLSSVQNGGLDEDRLDYTLVFCGVRAAESKRFASMNGLCIGSPGDRNLVSIRLDSFPKNAEQLQATMDRSGWAVVSNPSMEEMLPLHRLPDSQSPTLGQFYSGTPVQVIEQSGAWSHVSIGVDDRLNGWMLTDHLETGIKMDQVQSAILHLSVHDAYIQRRAYASSAMTDEADIPPSGWLVGTAENHLYIVLTESGQTGYAPQEWFWEGNG